MSARPKWLSLVVLMLVALGILAWGWQAAVAVMIVLGAVLAGRVVISGLYRVPDQVLNWITEETESTRLKREAQALNDRLENATPPATGSRRMDRL